MTLLALTFGQVTESRLPQLLPTHHAVPVRPSGQLSGAPGVLRPPAAGPQSDDVRRDRVAPGPPRSVRSHEPARLRSPECAGDVLKLIITSDGVADCWRKPSR